MVFSLDQTSELFFFLSLLLCKRAPWWYRGNCFIRPPKKISCYRNVTVAVAWYDRLFMQLAGDGRPSIIHENSCSRSSWTRTWSDHLSNYWKTEQGHFGLLEFFNFHDSDRSSSWYVVLYALISWYECTVVRSFRSWVQVVPKNSAHW